MDPGLYIVTLLSCDLCLLPFFRDGALALILLTLALGHWNLHNRAPRHDLPDLSSFMDTGLYYVYAILLSCVLCLLPFFWYGALALILLTLALGYWNVNNCAPRHDLPGPGFYLGIGPILSSVRFWWTGMAEATNYYSRTYGNACLVWVDWRETIIFSKSDDILQALQSPNYAVVNTHHHHHNLYFNTQRTEE